MGRGIAEQEDPGSIHGRVKDELKKEKYVDDLRDRRGSRLKFRFRTRSSGLRAEVRY